MRYFGMLMLALAGVAPYAPAQGTIDLGTARLVIDAKGCAGLDFGDGGASWPVSAEPIVHIRTKQDTLFPESVAVESNRVTARFAGGASCELACTPANGFGVFEMTRYDGPHDAQALGLFTLALPCGSDVMATLNAGRTPTHTVALSAAEVNVRAFTESSGRHDSDRARCTHTFERAEEAKTGISAARFTATSDAQPGGWSCSDCRLLTPLDLTGLKAIRAWVRGDAKGELLKIQLSDGIGGCRDTYIPITFEGWQQVNIAEAPYDTLRYGRVSALNLYYNGLPPSQTVSCIVDHVEAIVARDGREEAVLLDDFEAASPFWADATQTLRLETVAQHGLTPARFGLLVAPNDALADTMERFEGAAGLPSPHPGGAWNKISPWVKRSYLFITSFKESQFDQVATFAHRGGFDLIVIDQDSWSRGTGHYDINTKNFPGGLDALKSTVQRFKQEGFHVGFHFLGASIYPPDTYITPVPDPRLFHDAEAELAADIDDTTDFIPTVAAPQSFPAQDGGYEGAGAVLRIDDEMMLYGERGMETPVGFRGCARGHLGSARTAHAKGAHIVHLKKSYGYCMYDMDTTLIDEVTSHFARVANACDIDMIYFDGSEALQGDHWYYNPRMHKAFFDKLARKDIILQASSFTHYSWHILARSASADGHGDLKGYLDERSGAFDAFHRDLMPLDIGWYYGYDPSATIDMFEYVLGATIGYNSSMSFQVSLDAAARHPFTTDILDLIARYERLRLSGRVPDDMRARLRIDPALAGVKPTEERAALSKTRREYRLLGEEGHETFQKVMYEPWREMNATTASGTVNVKQGPARVGVQFQALPGPWLAAGPSYGAKEAVTLESFDDLASYKSQSTLDGVTQEFRVVEQDAKEGARCAVYSAENTRASADGWSFAGKTFDPPLDLSWHKAIGFWLRGDGKGGAFKLQLTDGAKAADFYITNDYTGWRYQQLPRPETDPMDFAHVRTLGIYYNGLPAKTAVSCAIDDVKALPSADAHVLSNPWVEVDGRKLAWQGTLAEGQYLFLWPGEPSRRYGLPLTAPEIGTAMTETIELSEGEHAVKFGCEGTLTTAVRVRLTLEPEERYEVPDVK